MPIIHPLERIFRISIAVSDAWRHLQDLPTISGQRDLLWDSWWASLWSSLTTSQTISRQVNPSTDPVKFWRSWNLFLSLWNRLCMINLEFPYICKHTRLSHGGMRNAWNAVCSPLFMLLVRFWHWRWSFRALHRSRTFSVLNRTFSNRKFWIGALLKGLFRRESP